MYYLKLPINKDVYEHQGFNTRYDGSTQTSTYKGTYYAYNLQVSNDSAFFVVYKCVAKSSTSTTRTIVDYVFITKCIVTDNYCYIPLTQEFNNYYSDFYTKQSTLSGLNGFGLGSLTSSIKQEYDNVYLSGLTDFKFFKYPLVDEDFVELGERYMFMLTSGNYSYILVLYNPNDIKQLNSIKLTNEYLTSNIPSYSTWNNYSAATKTNYWFVSQSTITYSKETITLSELISLIGNEHTSYNDSIDQNILDYHKNIYFSKSSLKCSVHRVIYDDTTICNSSFGSYLIAFRNKEVMTDVLLGDSVTLTNDFSSDTKVYINSTKNAFHIKIQGKGNNITGDLTKNPLCIVIITSNYETYQHLDGHNYYGMYLGYWYRYESSDNYYYSYLGTTIYQDTYTPTNKLQTLTFSDLEVLHNEESGTFALTFKINNPNEVSVSTNIHISGREDITDITAPSGTSEWSYIIDENKDGTIQATDISALGYENADDSAVYKYLAWVEPGYLRELVIDNVYLSTIDDKTYTLNILVINNNSVTIPSILHYGKTAENEKSISLKSGTNVFAITNVDNSNGSVWLHPEKVDGYYQLPDTSTKDYTKLPSPPTPASTGITLFKNNNNNKVVNKGYKLETYKTLNGSFRDSINILNPIFQIENDEVPDCNYCYIADFRRYYYIDSITCVRTGLYELRCSVDVLYTYKDNILSSEQYITRQENEYNELLVDNMVTFDSDYEYVIRYQNIDELDYAIIDGYNDDSKTNIILCTYGG